MQKSRKIDRWFYRRKKEENIYKLLERGKLKERERRYKWKRKKKKEVEYMYYEGVPARIREWNRKNEVQEKKISKN